MPAGIPAATGMMGAGAGGASMLAPMMSAMPMASPIAGAGAGAPMMGAMPMARPAMGGGPTAGAPPGGGGMFGGMFDQLQNLSPEEKMRMAQMGMSIMGGGEQQQQAPPPQMMPVNNPGAVAAALQAMAQNLGQQPGYGQLGGGRSPGLMGPYSLG